MENLSCSLIIIARDRNLNFALSGDRAEMSVVGEGDVVGGVPVEAVAVHVEGHRVQHVVDGGDHLSRR